MGRRCDNHWRGVVFGKRVRARPTTSRNPPSERHQVNGSFKVCTCQQTLRPFFAHTKLATPKEVPLGKSVLQNVTGTTSANGQYPYGVEKSYVKLARSRRARFFKETEVHPHFREKVRGARTEVDPPEGSQPLVIPSAKLADGLPILL